MPQAPLHSVGHRVGRGIADSRSFVVRVDSAGRGLARVPEVARRDRAVGCAGIAAGVLCTSVFACRVAGGSSRSRARISMRTKVVARSMRDHPNVVLPVCWDAQDVESWQTLGLFEDPSDPRCGAVELHIDPLSRRVRLRHGEYGPVPWEGRAIEVCGEEEEVQGDLALEFDVADGADGQVKRLLMRRGDLYLPDGSVSRRLGELDSIAKNLGRHHSLQLEAQRADADAYSNAASLLGQLAFSKEQCDDVILSRRLLKQWHHHTLAQSEPSRTTHLTNKSSERDSEGSHALKYRVPADWMGVRRHKELCVGSWLPRVGSWGDFDIEAAYQTWLRSERAASEERVPSLADLRAHGYLNKFFAACSQDALEQQRLLRWLREPHTAVAQYLVRYSAFWSQNPNRIDEIEAHFEAMTPEHFAGASGTTGASDEPPTVLLARLARDQKMSRLSTETFAHFMDVNPLVYCDGDLSLELLRSAQEIGTAADKLNNCAASYADRAECGACLLAVLRLNGTLVAMGEWSPEATRWAQTVEHSNARIRGTFRDVFEAAAPHMPRPLVVRWRQGASVLKCWSPAGIAILKRALGCRPSQADEIVSPALVGDSIEFDLQGAGLASHPEAAGVLLCLAAEQDREQLARCCLELGADPNAKDVGSWTALHEAASSGHFQIVRLLVESGVGLNPKERLHFGPVLHQASKSGHTEIFRLLVESGADRHAKDGYGRTALDFAARHGRMEIVRLLIDSGVDLNVKGLYNGRTALHEAAEGGHAEVARALVAATAADTAPAAALALREARCTAVGCGEMTALHIAASRGHAEMVELLVGLGADRRARNSDGQTALQLAQSLGHVEIVRLLEV